MKKILFFVVIIIITQANVFGQKLTIKDKDSGRPLNLVSLSSANPLASATTNTRGQVDISDFKGSDAIEFRLLGYQGITLSYNALKELDFTIALSQSLFSLDEIVVSATRWEQNKREVPNKITSINVKQIELQNPQTAADMLGNTGEVFIQKSQLGGGSPMIRGFATNRLLYSIDGVRMNTAIFRAGNIQNVISVDPFSIETSEVFFGPGSNIYGSDAIGGVMIFRTLTPQLSENKDPLVKGKALARYSSANNEITGHFDVGIGWQKWAFTSSVTNFNFGNLMQGSRGPDDYLKRYYVKRVDSVDRVFVNENPRLQTPSGYTQTNIMQKVRFKPDEKWDFNYGFHYSETSEYARYDRMAELSKDGLPNSAVWNYGPQKWMMNHLEITHSDPNPVYDQLVIRVAYQKFEESRIDRKFNNNRLRTQLEEVEALSFNADFLKRSGKNNFFYGIEAVVNDVVSTGSAVNIKTGKPVDVPDRYPDSKWKTYAAYINYQYRLSQQLLLQAGGRYSQYFINSDFDKLLAFYPFDYKEVEVNKGSPTGSVGAVYTPTDKWTLSTSLSTGFRAPNVDDIGKMYDFKAGDVIVPNPDLKAEYAYNGEINITKVFGSSVKFDITGFYTYLDNAIVRREYTVNGQDSIIYNGEMSKVFALQNAADAFVYGINAGLEIKLPEGFGISGRYNYQFGEEEMEDGTTSRSRHSAPSFGYAKLTYNANRLDMQFSAVFNGKIDHKDMNIEEQQKTSIYAADKDGNPYVPSWTILNFKAMYRLTDMWTISAGLENITDRRYRTYSSGISAPGRNMVLSLIANF